MHTKSFVPYNLIVTDINFIRQSPRVAPKKTLHYYRLKESVKFGCGTNWEIFGTAKPYEPSFKGW